LHCEGCAKKVKRSVRHFEGVDDVKADCATNKLTVIGKADPATIRDKVAQKTKKTVELISSHPKKAEEKKPDEKKAEEKKPDEKKSEEKKAPKELPVSTEVLKIKLHCDGCAHKIKRTISKIDGVQKVTADSEKDLVMVTGTMDAKALISYLNKKLKRSVEVVPAKKEEKGGEKKEKDGGGDKKEKEAGGGDKKEKEGGGGGDGAEKKKEGDAGGEKKKEGETKAASGGGDGSKSVESKVEVNKMEYSGYNPHTYTMPMYNQNYLNQDYGVSTSYHNEGYPNHGYMVEYPPQPMYSHPPPPPPPSAYLHDPNGHQIFSDENPNACFVM